MSDLESQPKPGDDGIRGWAAEAIKRGAKRTGFRPPPAEGSATDAVFRALATTRRVEDHRAAERQRENQYEHLRNTKQCKGRAELTLWLGSALTWLREFFSSGLSRSSIEGKAQHLARQAWELARSAGCPPEVSSQVRPGGPDWMIPAGEAEERLETLLKWADDGATEPVSLGAAPAGRTDRKTDTRKKTRNYQPRDLPRLVAAKKRIERLLKKGRTKIDAAKEITGNKDKAESLLKALRRAKPLIGDIEG
jgi:hypothetical protein